MNKFSKLMKIGVLLALSGGLFSCGGTSSPAGGTSANSSDGSEVTESESSQVSSNTVEITFWTTFNKKLENYIDRYAKNFAALVKKNEGVDISITAKQVGGYDEIFRQISTGLGTGNIPTMAIAYPDHVATYLQAENGNAGRYVVNLDKYINDEKVGFGKESYIGDVDASDFVEAFYKEGSSYTQKGTYSLPLMKSSEVLYYNKEYLAELVPVYTEGEVQTPVAIDNWVSNLTWDEYMAFNAWIKDEFMSGKVTKRLDGKDITINSLVMPAFYDDDANLFISKAYQNGGGYLSLDENGKGQIDFDSAKNKAMVEEFRAQHAKGYFETKGSKGEYGSNYFTTGQCVFDVGSSGGASYQVPSGDLFTVGVAKVPASNNNPLYITQGPTMTLLNNVRYSAEINEQRQLYAWKFMKYLTGAEVNGDLCISSEQGYVPVRNSAYETDDFLDYLDDPDQPAIVKNTKVVKNDIDGKYIEQPYFPGSSTARDQVGAVVTAALTGNESVDTLFKNAVNQVKADMSE